MQPGPDAEGLKASSSKLGIAAFQVPEREQCANFMK